MVPSMLNNEGFSGSPSTSFEEQEKPATTAVCKGRERPAFAVAADSRGEDATDKPTNGMYAWMVIIACAIALMLSIGINDAYGVYQQQYQLNEFPEASATLISWIGTVQFLVMCLGGIFSGFLCEHFDTRMLNALGAVCMGIAFIGGSFCTTVPGLMATQGLLYGIGASFPFVAGTSIPSQWFTRRRGLATGIALSGSGVGGMWMTSATQALIERWGRPWAMRVTGIVAMVAVGAVSPCMRVRFVPSCEERLIDWSLLRSPLFLVYMAAIVFAVAAYFGPFYQVPSYSVIILHKSETWGANMDTLMNGLSIAGRLAVGFLADLMGPLNLLIANMVLAASSLLVLWVPFDTTGTLLAMALLFGFAIGGIVSVIPVVAAEIFGLVRLPSIIGLLFIGYFIGGLLGVPPMSALLDTIGHKTNYTSSIWYMTALPICSLLFLLTMRLLITRRMFIRV